METMLTHTSALEALRMLVRAPVREPFAMPDAHPDVEGAVRSWQEAFGSNPTLPLHVLVPPGSPRVRSCGLITHAMSSDGVPRGSIRLVSGLSAVLPEDLCLRMAPGLTKLELLVLMEELMGTYAIREDLPDGMLTRPFALLTPDDVRACIASAASQRGANRVRWAFGRTIPGSASPRESKLALRLSLKPALGGYGLCVLALNREVEVASVGGALTQARRPDVLLCNPELGERGPLVALEYDGAVHLEEERHSRDIRRTNELVAAGLSEYVLDKALYGSQRYMDSLVTRIRHDLGLSRQHLSKAQEEARSARRRELYEELERIDGITWNGRSRKAEEPQPEPDDVVPLEAYGV